MKGTRGFLNRAPIGFMGIDFLGSPLRVSGSMEKYRCGPWSSKKLGFKVSGFRV